MRRFFTFVLLLIAISAIFPLYTRYKVIAAPVPPGVYLGGLDLSDLKDLIKIRQHLEGVYHEPIAVNFGGERMPLTPQEVDFHVEVDQMVREAMQYLDGADFIDIAVREAFGFSQRRRDVPIRFTLNMDKLRAWLQARASERNSQPSPVRSLTPEERWSDGANAVTGLPPGFVGVYHRDWAWMPGTPGYTLDVEASIQPVVQALTRLENRSADLVLQITLPPPPTLADLTNTLSSFTANFPGFAALYLHDLTTGEEGFVDADVAFSGMSTMKIGIATAVMQKLANGIQADDQVSYEVGQWLDYALGESNNHAANQLLRWLGDGDIGAGVRRFTDFMHSLDFPSTYMQSGYDVDVQFPQLPTPGNQRQDWNTNPDSNIQTTPTEMGRLLTAIYECTQGKGLLIERYADTITPEECLTILFYMSHDEFQELVWGGLPEKRDAWIVHKHGFAFESHSDVALVWGPDGPYILGIFLYRKGWMDWANSNGTMKAVSRGVWRFFEFRRDHFETKPLTAFTLPPPPGYVKIKDYIPIVSTGEK